LEIKNIEFINKRRIEMKYIVVLVDNWGSPELMVFETKEELLKFLNDKGWKLNQTVNWDELEQYKYTLAEYIAEKVDKLGRRTEAYLRVVKG